MLPTLSFLAGTAEARELSSGPYSMPTTHEVTEICASSNESCAPAVTRGECVREKAEFHTLLRKASEQTPTSPETPSLTFWHCSVVPLEASLCRLNLSEELPLDSDGDGRISFPEAVKEEVIAASDLLGYETLSPFNFEFNASVMDDYIRALAAGTFCPADVNGDGNISPEDDVNGSGTIDDKDRSHFMRATKSFKTK